MQKARLLIAALLMMSPFAVSADIIRFHHDGTFDYSSSSFGRAFFNESSSTRHSRFEFTRHQSLRPGFFEYRDFGYHNARARSDLSRMFNDFLMRHERSVGRVSSGHHPGDFGSTLTYRYFWIDSRYRPDFLSIDESTSGSVSVPEPGTLGLLGAALAGIGLMRRRRSV
jgi:hypothetical protein